MTSAHGCMDTRIFHKECKLLSDFFHISLIAPHHRDERIDNVNIISLPKGGRIENFLINPIKILNKALKLEGDIYHFHDPSLLPIGIFLSVMGKKVIYDVHEDTPKQILQKYYIPKLFRHFASLLFSLLEKFSTYFISGFICVTPDIASKFPKEKTIILHNYPIKKDFVLINEHKNRELPTIIYVGNYSKIRGIDSLIMAAQRIYGEKKFRIEIFGKEVGKNLRNELEESLSPETLRIFNPIPNEAIRRKLKMSDIGVLLYRPTPNNERALPTKLFEYMASGIPVLASNLSAISEVIIKNRCGIVVDPDNIDEVTMGLKKLISDRIYAKKLGRNGRTAVEKGYNFESEFPKLMHLYKKILSVK